MRLSQIHGQQDTIKGVNLLIKNRYLKDDVFKSAVDSLVSSGLDRKSILRVAEVAAFEVDYRGHLEYELRKPK